MAHRGVGSEQPCLVSLGAGRGGGGGKGLQYFPLSKGNDGCPSVTLSVKARLSERRNANSFH